MRGPWLTASMWMDGDRYEATKGTNGHGAPHQLECPMSVCRDSGSEPSSGTSSVIAGLAPALVEAPRQAAAWSNDTHSLRAGAAPRERASHDGSSITAPTRSPGSS
ncbi:unnamed protein product [Rangifer tarandus platyrhynchus]|uniref:Uncharacterized protein n=2 Tax=Rangifer tarandus platyrhynchus TaxID=3082113 RepID=A0ACB0F6F8_RANTA|nr:unnamed protein product [Rangifer tarandus platyrhynchus]CAI9708640.1 unnamed protein product [Rangifer tarandus platyrhynchus]